MVWHEKINSLYIGLYELKTISHLRVGSGEVIKLPTPIDNPQTRILVLEPSKKEGKWYVYIPASSLHGVIRSSLETYLRTMSPNYVTFSKVLEDSPEFKDSQEMKSARNKLSKILLDSVDSLPLYPGVCYTTFDFDRCEIPFREGDTKWKNFIHIGRKRDDGSGQPYLCYVCQTFGASGYRGRVRVLNAYPSKNTLEDLPLEIITRTAINRITGAVEEGSLFDLEAIPPGTKFYFAVVVENAFDELTYLKGFKKEELLSIFNKNNDGVSYLDLFKAGVSMISKGLVNIGAHGTIGFGYVSLTEKASLSIREDRIKDFVKMFVANKFEEIYKYFKDDFSKNNKDDLDICESFYPDIIRLLINFYRKVSRE